MLTKISRTVKSEMPLIILGASTLLIFVFFIFSHFTSKNKPSQNTPQGAAYKNIITPGTTTKTTLEKTLGKPTKVENKNNQTLYNYPTSSQFRNDQVSLSNDIVNLVKEQVNKDEKGKLSNYISKYGKPETILYGSYGEFDPGHFWGKNGILIFGSDRDGTIIEIWYFKPTTLEDFLKNNPDIKTEQKPGF